MSNQIVTVREFEERLAAIYLDGQGAFPKKPRDREILYRSILQSMDSGKNYSATEINAALQNWLLMAGAHLRIDHVTLRRYLVDEMHLARDSKGTSYQVNLKGRGEIEFEDAVAKIDSFAVIERARLHAAERKQSYGKKE